MHHWEVDGEIKIGCPDFGQPEFTFTIVNMGHLGQEFRARVTDSEKKGDFVVMSDCPEVVLEMLAEQATQIPGFKVTFSNLQCSVDGKVLRSLDYEWYPVREYAQRPTDLAYAISESLEAMKRGARADEVRLAGFMDFLAVAECYYPRSPHPLCVFET